VPATLELLRGKGYGFLASVHGVDYFPEEPRLGVHYELLDMSKVDRISVRTRVSTDAPNVPSVTPDWPTADHQEREIYDMFGVIFDGHTTSGASSCPRTTRATRSAATSRSAASRSCFTHNERDVPGWWK
jgi:NADH-quinone oxidoreductase subunit C